MMRSKFGTRISSALLHCSQCQALYQVVKAEAGPETVDRPIFCLACAGPLIGREGQYIFKYFHLRNATRRKKGTGDRTKSAD